MLAIDRMASVAGVVYSDPPDIVIVDLTQPDHEMRELLGCLKGDSYFSAIPVIGLIGDEITDTPDWEQFPVDDFVLMPVRYPELFARIELSLKRIRRVFDNNPLTRLPGNTSIQKAIEGALGNPMAVCYIDIDHFKPYNDIYGFTHGDEVIRMLARIMFNAVKESGGGFTGHVGGDDFVCIVPVERAELVARTVIRNFGLITADLFGEEERSNGYYRALNRRGEDENIPLLGVSIAIVPTDSPKFTHCGKVAEVAAELKKLAKQSVGSCFVIDRRKT